MKVKEIPGKSTAAADILDKLIQAGKTPAVQYIHFSQDSIIYEYQNGYADLKSGMKVDKNTTFHVFSITKTFTALSVIQLAERNLIDIEKPVKTYLPDSGLPEDVTVKHLLSHTAGLANPIPLSWIHPAEEHETFSRNEFFAPILKRHARLKSKPGEKFAYTNLGYIILGQVIEAVTGTTYEQYVKEHIIDKLPISPQELGFEIKLPVLHAKGYHNKYSFSNLILGLFLDKSKYMDAAVGKWKPFKDNYVNGAPYGGLIGTANAFVKYGQSLLKGNSELVSDQYKSLIFEETKTTDGKPAGMCLSWYNGDLNGQTYYTHAGGGGGYYCEIRLYPRIGKGSFIVFSRSGFSDERFLSKLDGGNLPF
jgi:D-alanyl-D-alanine carboxypeptidase